jgi:hypothetical protein
MMATVSTDNVCIVPTNFKESNLIGPRVTTCFVPPYKCFDGPTTKHVITLGLSAECSKASALGSADRRVKP